MIAETIKIKEPQSETSTLFLFTRCGAVFGFFFFCLLLLFREIHFIHRLNVDKASVRINCVLKYSMFQREEDNEVLQDIPGIHARPGAEAPWGWLQEAQKDHEEV